MTKLPQIKPTELARVLRKLGYQSRPGKGSHVIFFRKDGKYISIPMHPKPLGKGLLNKILKQLNIGRDQLMDNV